MTDSKTELFSQYPEKYRVKLSDLPTDLQEKIHQTEIDSERHQGLFEFQVALAEDSEFDLTKALEQCGDPLIEIAGPTDRGFEFVDVSKLDGRLIVTNLENGLPRWFDGEKVVIGKVDQKVDATNLPFKTASVGGILCAALNRDLRERFLSEAERVLRKAGLLICEGLVASELEQINKLGFRNVRLKTKISWPKDDPKEKSTSYDGVWVKQ